MLPERILLSSYEVKYICDRDGAEMLHTGVMLASNPPLYPHKCKECGNTKNLSEIHPLTRWQPIDKPHYY